MEWLCKKRKTKAKEFGIKGRASLTPFNLQSIQKMAFPDISNILIVFALEVESQGKFSEMNLLHCGVGKVNAAHRLSAALHIWQKRAGVMPQLVLNLGSAGSSHFAAKQVVNCTRFIQRDFDVTGLDFPRYVTPFEDIPKILSNGLRVEGLPEAICGTGDNFVTSEKMLEWNIVDMEAYALAKVCLFEKVPFACLKYITDGADGQAATSWEEGLTDTALTLKAAMEKIS